MLQWYLPLACTDAACLSVCCPVRDIPLVVMDDETDKDDVDEDEEEQEADDA